MLPWSCGGRGVSGEGGGGPWKGKHRPLQPHIYITHTNIICNVYKKLYNI